MAKIGDIICKKYKVLEVLGQGGVSHVYLVEDLKLQKNWAVKEITGLQEQWFVQSVMTEINVMKKLDHPALPRIVDVIENGDSIYVIMDYIEGENLNSLLNKNEKISQERMLKWAKELCDVLCYLHEQKPPIIYRDMKPANIIISHSGDVKLIDLGCAREYKEEGEEDTINLGTRGYAAPEQFGGKGQTDVRTDIYSLGVTLYQVLTGERPWGVSEYFKRNRQGKLTAGWEYIIKKCIWKNPNLRYQSCAELKKDLNNYEKLNKKYQKKKRWKERLKHCLKSILMLCFLSIIIFTLMENLEMLSEIIEKAEKEKIFSALKTILDSLFQKIREFLNL
ncbi:MAG: serine/threonine protein kinase [Lachnospiraceae bacterium]|nr:serine/threonine protein kinase [Lachnospiraceae bacterium]